MLIDAAILLALTSLVCQSYAKPVPSGLHGLDVSADTADGILDTSVIDLVEDIVSGISDFDVIHALELAGCPDAVPRQTWSDEDGVYQKAYSFDTAEWNAMYMNLTGALANVESSGISKRQSGGEPEFYCRAHGTWAWTYTVGAVAGSVCTSLGFGAEYGGRTQIVERTRLRNIQNQPIRTIFKYVWKAAKWANVGACTTAIEHGLNTSCTVSQPMFYSRH